ncbi:MAG TPA: helix-turn-helix domain-containing protein [Anaeromyxobacteraceae bacterium]|nr:helix-turn-helix domain-containing protein [Anaeromyxobacteraceae bacterium]
MAGSSPESRSSANALTRRVASGALRPELYYRLNVLRVPVPPLRDRLEDIPELVKALLQRAQGRNPAGKPRSLAPDAMIMLSTYAWPGNIRELENLLERLVIVGPSLEIGVKDLEAHVKSVMASPSPADLFQDRIATLREMEDKYIGWAISKCGGNKTRAAELLGIDVSTIHRRERDRPS